MPAPPQLPGQHARLRGCPGGDFIYLLRHFWAVFEDPYTTFYLLNVSLECDANWALNTSILEDPCEVLGYFFQSLECGPKYAELNAYNSLSAKFFCLDPQPFLLLLVFWTAPVRQTVRHWRHKHRKAISSFYTKKLF